MIRFFHLTEKEKEVLPFYWSVLASCLGMVLIVVFIIKKEQMPYIITLAIIIFINIVGSIQVAYKFDIFNNNKKTLGDILKKKGIKIIKKGDKIVGLE